MGKAGRAACIFTPLALSIASFVCIILINLGGFSKHSDTLNDLYFFEADFSNFTTSSSSSTELSLLLEAAKDSGDIADQYRINLWNYCTVNSTSDSTSNSSDVDWCSARKRNFWFNPLEVWNIESIINSTGTSAGADSNVLVALESLASNTTALEDQLLDKSARDALKTYKKVSAWLWSAYFASLWLLLGTVVFGCLAVFTRFFSFLTFITSILATVLVFGGSITASIMFPLLVKALKETFKDYNVDFTTNTHMLAVTWLATAFTLVATFFWLFSICCCSGKSDNIKANNQAAPSRAFPGFGRGNRGGADNEKFASGGRSGYAPVESPYAERHGAADDHVPLTQVAVPPYGHGEATEYGYTKSPYEPYRHN
ncbi:hypothetical protein AAFC00_006374 [Neodothiora populina]|uniref:SUR7 protein n=1 Tax=Neodothiora populina TaxID=2781224 RepID=A0ABR3P5Q6_9PEZI